MHKPCTTHAQGMHVQCAPGSGVNAVPKGGKLFQVDAEENLPEVVKTQDIAKSVIK